YVAVEGYPGTSTTDDLTGVVVHSDMPSTGTFKTSNPLLNQLQQNIVWGQKGNFVDIPTDTPARDERLGWTGDAQAFSPTAAFNYNVASFFTRWLRGLAADQGEGGNYPVISPLPPDGKMNGHSLSGGHAGWSDAGIIIPWDLYLVYGDQRVLAEQYPSMKAWVDFLKRVAGDDLIWNESWQFGDWLAFATTDPGYPGATTDKDLIATAFYAHSADLLSRVAGVLGKTDDARAYRELFESVKQAFNREFVTAKGRLASNTQTAYALGLQFDLLPDSLRTEAARRLAQDVRSFKHLTTGFLGTPHLNHALSQNGYLDEAYMLLMRKEYPSWLYPVTRGATTVWERWDGIKPDSTFQDVGMNSFNHYAYGAVGDWMYQTVAGLRLDPRQPGYKHSFIEPRPGGELTHARATFNSMYGEVGSAWERNAGTFRLTATVPPNTSATVRLPGAQLPAVTEGGKPVERVEGVRRAYQDGSDVVVEVGSGTYRFAYPQAQQSTQKAENTNASKR
ncbi:MAG TPA: alpha-L-rhamnosidase C-terminal domain-containing protein, partial [Chloroflexota bacterium]|nr:alpha-L-rhamnosidase C-terminal domain-containing protein [Chloroflexota bacterium]